MGRCTLWADGYQAEDGTWTAIVGDIDENKKPRELERREGRRTQYHSELSLEAMWRKWSQQPATM
jgi:hypothetical protein